MRHCKTALVPILAGLLTACGQTRTVIKTIEVPVRVYVPVPAEFTKPVPIEQRRNDTVGECPRVARARAAQLQQCNLQLKAIKKLGDE